jgi:hypothetical protein
MPFIKPLSPRPDITLYRYSAFIQSPIFPHTREFERCDVTTEPTDHPPWCTQMRSACWKACWRFVQV